MAAAKTKVEAPKPPVAMYLGQKAYVYEGKMYFTPEEGGPVMVQADHVDFIQARIEQDDEKNGRDAQLAPTDPLANATREELVRELIRVRAQAGLNEAGDEPLDIVATSDGSSGEPAGGAPPVQNPFVQSA